MTPTLWICVGWALASSLGCVVLLGAVMDLIKKNGVARNDLVASLERVAAMSEELGRLRGREENES